MKKRHPAQVLLAALLSLPLAGTALAVEEPEYEVLREEGAIELRAYGATIVAETAVTGDFEEAGSQAFRALFHLEFYRLTFNQRFEAVALNGRKMYEHIGAAIGRSNKTKTFGLVKPFNGTCNHSVKTSSNRLIMGIQLQIIKGNVQELPLGASE